MKTGMCAIAIALGACGGGDAATPDATPPTCAMAGGAACFQLPTAPMLGHGQTTVIPAVLGCGPIVPTPSTMDVTLNGLVKNYSGGAAIASASLEIYASDDFTGPIVTATSAVDGTFSLVIPSGTPDLLFGKVSASGFNDTYLANQRPDLTLATIDNYQLPMTNADFLDTVYGLVDATWDHSRAGLAVTVRDCERRVIEHAVVDVSSTSGQRDFVDAQVFYGAAGSVPLPVPPDVRGDTNDNGAAAAINVPLGGAAFLQVWGFPDDAAVAQGEAGLVLVAEYPLTLFADELLGYNAWANQ